MGVNLNLLLAQELIVMVIVIVGLAGVKAAQGLCTRLARRGSR